MKVKVGLALVPELAQKADASFQFQCTPLLPLLPLLPSTVHADKADLTLLNKASGFCLCCCFFPADIFIATNFVHPRSLRIAAAPTDVFCYT